MKNARAKWMVIGLIAVLALIQLIQPSRTNPPVIASRISRPMCKFQHRSRRF